MLNPTKWLEILHLSVMFSRQVRDMIDNGLSFHTASLELFRLCYQSCNTPLFTFKP